MNRISSARVQAAARQHGAMEYSSPPCDLDEVRRYRLGRVRGALAERDLEGIILYDQLNQSATLCPAMPEYVTPAEFIPQAR